MPLLSISSVNGNATCSVFVCIRSPNSDSSFSLPLLNAQEERPISYIVQETPWLSAFEIQHLVVIAWRRKMGSHKASSSRVFIEVFIGICFVWQSFALEVDKNQTAQLLVNASEAVARPIPETLFGIFFEEINHAGAGGLWAELISNRGFEAGGQSTPSNIDPWSIIGDESFLILSTDRSSCFERNTVALRMDVLCDNQGTKVCPAGGVGVYNPGFWGMNIEKGKTYKVVFHVRSSTSINLSLALAGSNGMPLLASANISASASDVSSWTKMEVLLQAGGTNHNSRIQLTTTQKGVIWFDQFSAMPLDTHMEHGFRNDLFQMLAEIKPRFLRFPGLMPETTWSKLQEKHSRGSFVEGEWLTNAFRWKETVGPWEERPGHFNDAWKYWTDDGLGYFEFLQLAEDLGALPVWVFNGGLSHKDQVETLSVPPFVKETLDGIEFARGDPDSTWGSVRAAMGHPEPFDLRYVAVGNQDCWKKNYRGNYLKFYDSIKHAYPDMQIISNCDGSSGQLDHPADLYDFHIYTSASNMFSTAHKFDQVSRSGPKAFISEYCVTGKDAGKGSLLAALAEAAFLLGLEKNSDVVAMASSAPLFMNANDRSFTPNTIVFNSSQLYGTPRYWMQSLFTESSGATLLGSTLKSTSTLLVTSAILWKDSANEKDFIRLKAVNFGNSSINLKISVGGFDTNTIQLSSSSKTVLTSGNLMDENSFQQPKKVSPKQIPLKSAGKDMELILAPYSFTSFDLLEQHIGSQDGEKLIHLQDPNTKKGSEGKDEQSYR